MTTDARVPLPAEPVAVTRPALVGELRAPLATSATETQRPRVERTSSHLRAAVEASGSYVRVGAVDVRSAARYLSTWALALFAVMVVVLVLGYALLAVLGVTGSVSRALAVILDQQLPASGVLPVLQPHRVVPALVLVSALLSGLWLVTATAAVMVHNAVSGLTGGLRVRVRNDARPRHRR